ncbi:hypothetical protein fugu_001869 [Takifugu bimaculatus]|uniref:Uncharacterized protein n=1 Tax=Takifugu bimaculatus TaxID=433685 RepID=A0A4Z2BN12_9TELE|nr:hypothetical protein fugu_001869 [Takifugu bimaculatus]
MAAYSRALTPDSSGSATPDRAMSPIQIVSVTTGTPDRTLSTEQVEMVGGHAVFRVSRKGNPAGRSREDNKIHIHLGNPFTQNIGSPSPCHAPGLSEQRTQVFANCSSSTARAHSKITSSIMIKPTSTPVQRPSQITIPLEAFRRPGPTRIPKPKGFGYQKVTNGTTTNMQSKSPSTTMKEQPVHKQPSPDQAETVTSVMKVTT